MLFFNIISTCVIVLLIFGLIISGIRSNRRIKYDEKWFEDHKYDILKELTKVGIHLSPSRKDGKDTYDLRVTFQVPETHSDVREHIPMEEIIKFVKIIQTKPFHAECIKLLPRKEEVFAYKIFK